MNKISITIIAAVWSVGCALTGTMIPVEGPLSQIKHRAAAMFRSKRMILSVIVWLACSLPCSAQERTTVYVWKTWHPNTIGRAAYDVFLDERPIAKLDRARFFVALIPPGKHVFRTKTREAGAVELDLEAGQTYYLRMDTSNSMLIGRPVLTRVSEEEGRAAIQQAKPINPDDIRDRTIIVMNLGAPPPAVESRTQPRKLGTEKVLVQVNSEPEGAEIHLDGEFVGSTPSKLEIAAGSHRLRVVRPGYRDWERQISVATGGSLSFNAILIKAEPPQ